MEINIICLLQLHVSEGTFKFPGVFSTEATDEDSVLMGLAFPEGFTLGLGHKYSVHRKHMINVLTNSLSKHTPKVCHLFIVCVSLSYL